MKSSNYFCISWSNPLTTYNKIKKYFKPIKPKLQFNCYIGTKAKIIELISSDVKWKIKYKNLIYETNPKIEFSLFNYFHWKIDFTVGENSLYDIVYWETILNWMYYNKLLHLAIKSTLKYTYYNSITNKTEPITPILLKDPWQTMYNNKQLPRINYEHTT